MKEIDVEFLFKKYYNEVLIYIFSICKDFYLAEDVVMEAFYKAIVKKNVEQEEGFKFWLIKVSRNLLFDKLKRMKRQTSLEDNVIDEKSENVIEKIICDEKYANLYLTINLLPLNYREVIIFYYFQELSTKQISKLVGQSEEYIRVLIMRARMKLKELLIKKENIK